jgi:hypothetical protein
MQLVFFYLRLVLHTFIQTFDVADGVKKKKLATSTPDLNWCCQSVGFGVQHSTALSEPTASRPSPSIEAGQISCQQFWEKKKRTHLSTCIVLFIWLIIYTFQLIFLVRIVFFSHNKSANSQPVRLGWNLADLADFLWEKNTAEWLTDLADNLKRTS